MDQDGLRFRVKKSKEKTLRQKRISKPGRLWSIFESIPVSSFLNHLQNMKHRQRQEDPSIAYFIQNKSPEIWFWIQPPFIMQPVSLYDKHGQWSNRWKIDFKGLTCQPSRNSKAQVWWLMANSSTISAELIDSPGSLKSLRGHLIGSSL